MRIVLIGKTGVGKSATGNSILGKKEFESRASARSVTNVCRVGKGQRMNRDICVVDTPGFFDTRMTNNEIRKEIVKCIAMSSPGPHAFVLVVRPDRFTKEEQETVNLIKETFGNEVMRYMMVLFVRKDDLDEEGVSIDEFVERSPAELKKVLRDCENKYIAFNNRASPDENEKQARSCIDMVVALQKRNGGQFYSHEIYIQAEKAMKRADERRIKELEEKKRQEWDVIRKQFLAEFKKREDEYIKRIEVLEQKDTKNREREEKLRQEWGVTRKQFLADNKNREDEYQKRIEALEQKYTKNKELEEKLRQERDAIRQKLLAGNNKKEGEYRKRIEALEEQIENEKATVREALVRDVGKDRFNIFDAIGGFVSSAANKCVIM